jgi:hypothetical protein
MAFLWLIKKKRSPGLFSGCERGESNQGAGETRYKKEKKEGKVDVKL